MKTPLIALIAVATLSASAASFDWGTGSDKVAFGDLIFNVSGYNVTGYLVHLGTSTDVSKLYSIDYAEPGSISGATSVQYKAPTVTGGASNKGKIKETFKGEEVVNGATFGMYLVYTDADGVSWFNYSTNVYTVSGISTGAEVLSAATFGFNYAAQNTITKEGESLKAGWNSINIAAVPEPSTAALALAGLALLIKRRRA